MSLQVRKERILLFSSPSCPQTQIAACPMNFAPVCGSDGNTYANESVFHPHNCSFTNQSPQGPPACMFQKHLQMSPSSGGISKSCFLASMLTKIQ
uniref:Kazal-like domain-containing protein n=1 Tax=Oryzias latipes TaxID=8090 RepID=A0A3P9I822_ORYLA